MGLIGFLVHMVVLSAVLLAAVWFGGYLEPPYSMVPAGLVGLGILWHLMSSFDD